MVDEGNSAAIIFNIPHPHNSELVFKTVECLDQSVKAVIDTGASISVISPNFCKKLNLIPNKWEGPKLLVAGELLVAPSGIAKLKGKIEEKL